ncbi:hypothetical protein SNEBB_001001 [Seison nebaliae]|nr:hypothetical protein SNEBB_001001 [Seison nebaliae]
MNFFHQIIFSLGTLFIYVSGAVRPQDCYPSCQCGASSIMRCDYSVVQTDHFQDFLKLNNFNGFIQIVSKTPVDVEPLFNDGDEYRVIYNLTINSLHPDSLRGMVSVNVNISQMKTLPKYFCSNVRLLELYDINVDEVDSEACPHTTRVTFNGGNSKSIQKFLDNAPSLNRVYINLKKGQFENFNFPDKVRRLVIEDTGIRSLGDSAIVGKNIEKLLLKNNRYLMKLKSGAFNRTRNVRNLVIEGNGITSLPRELFKNLNNLKTLQLFNNRITHLKRLDFSPSGKVELLLDEKFLQRISENAFCSVNNEFKKIDLRQTPAEIPTCALNMLRNNPDVTLKKEKNKCSCDFMMLASVLEVTPRVDTTCEMGSIAVGLKFSYFNVKKSPCIDEEWKTKEEDKKWDMINSCEQLCENTEEPTTTSEKNNWSTTQADDIDIGDEIFVKKEKADSQQLKETNMNNDARITDGSPNTANIQMNNSIISVILSISALYLLVNYS